MNKDSGYGEAGSWIGDGGRIQGRGGVWIRIAGMEERLGKSKERR